MAATQRRGYQHDRDFACNHPMRYPSHTGIYDASDCSELSEGASSEKLKEKRNSTMPSIRLDIFRASSPSHRSSEELICGKHKPIQGDGLSYGLDDYLPHPTASEKLRPLRVDNKPGCQHYDVYRTYPMLERFLPQIEQHHILREASS